MDITLSESDRKDKKFKVVIIDDTKKTIHFGQRNASDYTIHKDKERKKLYIDRHRKREDWTKKGIKSAGFWSRWLLWNKESLKGSLKDIEKRYKVRITFH